MASVTAKTEEEEMELVMNGGWLFNASLSMGQALQNRGCGADVIKFDLLSKLKALSNILTNFH